MASVGRLDRVYKFVHGSTGGFLPVESVDHVLMVPLPSSPCPDVLAWRFENTGVYTVKSAYEYLAQENNQNLQTTTSDEARLYKYLRAVKLPPKYYIFTGKLLWDTCQPTLSYIIAIFETVFVVTRLLRQFFMRLGTVHRSVRYGTDSTSPGVLKINFDAGYPNISLPTTTKATACLHVVQVAYSWGWNEVIFEGDSLTVVKAMSSQTSDRSPISAIVATCKELVVGFRCFDFKFVKRLGNLPAHQATKHHRSTSEDVYWSDEDTITFKDALVVDRLSLSIAG